MPLQPPKRTPAGFYLGMAPPVVTPSLRWADGAWIPTPEWDAWADQQRKALIGELLSHGSWFSKPPRHEMIDPLFTPLVSRTMAGVLRFTFEPPATPGGKGSSGSGIWELQGLVMSPTSITPVFTTGAFTEDEKLEAIPFFDDATSVGSTVNEEGDDREIQIEDIEDAPAAAEPTKIRNREWEARKFMAKERVREYRLKAQIAIQLAEKEEARYFKAYGDFEDGESRFSDYDLSDEEDRTTASTNESD